MDDKIYDDNTNMFEVVPLNSDTEKDIIEGTISNEFQSLNTEVTERGLFLILLHLKVTLYM